MNQQERKNLVDLCFVHSKGTPEQRAAQRRQLEALADSQLIEMADEIRRNVAQEDLRRAGVKLALVNEGLEGTVGKDPTGALIEHRNWQVINQRLPGDTLTVEAFRKLLESDPSFKRSLVFWKEPFADTIREEQEQAAEQLASERKRRSEFSAVVNHLTASGVADIADTDANFDMACERLEELLVFGNVQGDFLQALTQAIVKKLLNPLDGVHGNTNEKRRELVGASRQELLKNYSRYFDGSPEAFQIKQWILDKSVPFAEIRERLELADQLAQSIGGTPNPKNPTELQTIRGRSFRSLVVSPTSSIESMRQQIAGMGQRSDLRKLSREELREIGHQQYDQARSKWKAQVQSIDSPFPPLPAEITKFAIINSTKEQQLEWHKKYGVAQINSRLEGRA